MVGDFGVELESRIASLGWDAVDEAFYAYIARLETQLWMRDFLGPPPASDIRAAAVSNDRINVFYGKRIARGNPFLRQ